MAGPAILKVDIIADATKAISAMNKVSGAAKETEKGTGKASSGLGAMAKTAAKVAGAAALGGVVAIMKTGVDEQSDYLKGQAQLQAGLKSTGNAANTSVKHMEGLASSIQNYSGQTDDSIVASEKLMLTFTGVRNAAGKNNDVFDQAIKMTADMAARMGGDASTYAVQLGKALNDPAKGVSKLTRLGVTFTDAQKKQIAAMSKAGDTAGAQKVMLQELQKEFGGSAKAAGQTLPGQMARAKRSFEDTAQGVVASLMPAITIVADLLTGTLLPAFQTTIGWMTKHKGVVVAFAGAIAAVYAAIKIGQATTALGQAGGLVAWIKQTNLAAGATKIWAGIQAVFNAIMDANPVVLVVLAVAALVAALILAYKKSAAFRSIVQATFKAIASAARFVWGVIKPIFKLWILQFQLVWKAAQKLASIATAAFRWIVDTVKKIPAAFRAMVTGIASVVSKIFDIWIAPYKLAWQWITNTLIPGVINAVKTVPRLVASALASLFGVIKTPFLNAWNWVAVSFVPGVIAWVRSIPGKATTALATLAEAIKAPFRAAWTWVAQSLVPGIIAWVRSIPGKVTSALSTLAAAIKAPFQAGWNWVKTNVIDKLAGAFGGVVTALRNAYTTVKNAITAPFSAAWSWIKTNVIDKISHGFSTIGTGFKTVWNAIANTINGIHISLKVPSWIPKLGGKGFEWSPHLPTLATGAYVSHATAAVVGERGAEFVAPDALLRRLIREESGPTIIVNGALDPDAVARQIDSILTRRHRRLNGPNRVGTATL